MLGTVNIKEIANAMVPISRFNKGEANRIFEEVNVSGVKIVVKNNSPACILLSPQSYNELMEIVENYYLMQVTEKRLEKTDCRTYSQSEVMKELNISEADLADIEVKIDGVDD